MGPGVEERVVSGYGSKECALSVLPLGDGPAFEQLLDHVAAKQRDTQVGFVTIARPAGMVRAALGRHGGNPDVWIVDATGDTIGDRVLRVRSPSHLEALVMRMRELVRILGAGCTIYVDNLDVLSLMLDANTVQAFVHYLRTHIQQECDIVLVAPATARADQVVEALRGEVETAMGAPFMPKSL